MPKDGEIALNWSIALLPWLLVGILGLIGMFGGWWLWWRLPKRQVDRLQLRDAKARADVEDSFRKTMGQLFGGAAVLLGAAFAYLQFQQQQRSTHDLLISNQVSKGFEQLGSDKLVLRLGGIYALEGVMNTSEQYHRPVLEALCAFVREHTNAQWGYRPPPVTEPEAVISNAKSLTGPATDIQAALAVVGRRASEGSSRLDLNGANIPGAFLPRANLRNAYLSNTDLRLGSFIDADLVFAFLNKADLAHAILIRADLTRAQLEGASLVFARLSGANLTDASLGGATLSYADLRGAKGLTQAQLNTGCGTEVQLDSPLTIKPCAPDRPR
jgi:uncharacterized protein YjbI with pentapeptide repeats